MIYNATIIRIDKYAGIVSELPTWTNGATLDVRCTATKIGSIFDQSASKRQLRYPNLGRILVPTASLPSVDAINQNDRIWVTPDRRPTRPYMCYVFDRIGTLDHVEIEPSDPPDGTAVAMYPVAVPEHLKFVLPITITWYNGYTTPFYAPARLSRIAPISDSQRHWADNLYIGLTHASIDNTDADSNYVLKLATWGYEQTIAWKRAAGQPTGLWVFDAGNTNLGGGAATYPATIELALP